MLVPEDVENSEAKEDKNGKLQDVDLETALEYCGFGKFNIILIVVSGFCLLAVNNESYAIGYILPIVECELNLDKYRKGVLTSTHFVGIVGSSFIWGYLADRYGRKHLIVVNLLLGFACSVAAAFAPSFWGFVLLRFFNGIFICAPSTLIYVFFDEFQSRAHQSKGMAWVSLFISLAIISLPALGWLILPMNFKWSTMISSWRLFMIVNSMPSLLTAFLFLQLPDTPKFLYYNGWHCETIHVLQTIYASNSKDGTLNASSYPVGTLKIPKLSDTCNNQCTFQERIAPLFKLPVIKYILAGSIMQAGIFAVSSGIFLWYPDIVNRLTVYSQSNNSSQTVCQIINAKHSQSIKFESNGGNAIREVDQCHIDDNVFIQNLIIGFAYFIGYSLWNAAVNVLGNRNFFVLCMFASVLSCLLLQVVTYKNGIDALFVVMMMLSGICVIIVNLKVLHSIPTQLCAMALCTVMTAGRFGSIVSSALLGIVLEWNCSMAFVLYALALSICLGLIFAFPAKKPQEIVYSGNSNEHI